MRVDDPDTSYALRFSYDEGCIVLKCPRCKEDMVTGEDLEEFCQEAKKLLGSNVEFITRPEYERIGKSLKCPKCHEIIGLTEIVTPSRKLARVDRGSEKSSETPPLSNIGDIRGMFIMGALNTIVGIVGLVYRSAWAFTLLVGLPALVGALLEYKDYKRVGWVPRIATVIACVLLGSFAALGLVIAFVLLPLFATGVLYLLVVNLVFIVPIFGQFWSPGKYGGYASLPQPLVWLIRICLALIGLVLLFVWIFLR